MGNILGVIDLRNRCKMFYLLNFILLYVVLFPVFEHEILRLVPILSRKDPDVKNLHLRLSN